MDVFRGMPKLVVLELGHVRSEIVRAILELACHETCYDDINWTLYRSGSKDLG